MTSFLTEKQINEANVQAKMGNLDKASTLFLKILTKFPKNIEAKNGLIFIHENLIKNYKKELLFYYNQKKYLEITKIGTKLVEKFSHSYFVWDILGASFLNQGNYLKAIWAYENLVSLNENYAEAYNNLGNLEKSGALRFKCNFASRSLATPRCEKQSALFGVTSKVIRSLLVEK